MFVFNCTCADFLALGLCRLGGAELGRTGAAAFRNGLDQGDGPVWVQRSQGTGWRRAGVPEPEGDGSPGQAGRIQALLLVVNWRLQSGETSVWLHPVINNIEY